MDGARWSMSLHLVALSLMFLFAVVLVGYEYYRDGFIGRMALLFGIALPSGAWLLEEVLTQTSYAVSNSQVFMFFGMAIFLGRTLYNAWRYRRRCRKYEEGHVGDRRHVGRRSSDVVTVEASKVM
jgi:hypothetical protein